MLYKGQLVKLMFRKPIRIAVVVENEEVNGSVRIQILTNNYDSCYSAKMNIQRAGMSNFKRFINTLFYQYFKCIPDNLKLMNIEQHLQAYVRPIYPGQPSLNKGGKKMK